MSREDVGLTQRRLSVLMEIFKKLVRQTINNLGYDLVTTSGPEINPDSLPDHPLDAVYGSHESKTVAINADLSRCSNYTGLTYGKNGWHPFATCLHEYKNGQKTYHGSYLQKYYQEWNPDNAKDAFLTFSDAPELLRKQPSFGFVSPWHCVTLSERNEAMRTNARSENRSAGSTSIGIEDGFALHGPVSKQKGEIEFKRLTETYDSIRTHGYQISSIEDLIVGFSLVDEETDNYRIIVIHGNHRLASLSVLKFTRVPIRLLAPFVVRRNEAHRWPQVQAGVWNIHNAQKYFDSMLLAHKHVRRWAAEHALLLQ